MAVGVTNQKISTKRQKAIKTINKFLVHKVLPPLCGLVIFLILWQLLCSIPGFQLPGPLETFVETWDPFIIKPFFDGVKFDPEKPEEYLNSLPIKKV